MKVWPLFLCLMAGGVWAQSGVLDRSVILKELEQLERSHRESVAGEQRGVGESLRTALASPKALLDAYADAVFSTRFEGTKKDNATFKKWKASQEPMFKDDAFQAALWLHANYLYLTLARASGEEGASLHESLIQHVRKVWAMESQHDLRKKQFSDLLDRPVSQGVLARYYGVGQKLSLPQDLQKPGEADRTWEGLAGNTDGILDKAVFPFLRNGKNPLLLSLWDERIQNESLRARRSGLNDQEVQFSQQTLPRLHWSRARDVVRLGNEAEGYSAMLGILRKNANHPDFDRYVSELRSLLN